MPYIEFDKERALDVIPLGRIAIDFNPIDYFKPWPQCETFKKYVGGSPANIAVGDEPTGKEIGLHRLRLRRPDGGLLHPVF